MQRHRGGPTLRNPDRQRLAGQLDRPVSTKIGLFANLNPPEKPAGFSPHRLPSKIATGVNAAVAVSPRTILGVLAVSSIFVGIAVIPIREIGSSSNSECWTEPSPASVQTASAGPSVSRRNQTNRGGCEQDYKYSAKHHERAQ